MRSMKLKAAILATFQCACVAAMADGTLDEVIVVANRPTSVGKLDAPLKDQPMNVTVITRDTLDDLGNPRLEDIAMNTVGLQAVAPAQGVTNYGFFVRGFNGAPTLVDGYYSSVNAFGSVGVFDMANVESVEILRGPAAILYGQGNPGGVVNLTTKQPKDTMGVSVGAFVDQHGARRIDGDYTTPLGSHVGFRVVGVLEDSETFRDFVNRDRKLIAPTLFIDAGERVSVKLNYVYDRLTYSPDNGPGTNADLIRNLPANRNVGEPLLRDIEAENQSARAEADIELSDSWTARLGYFVNRGRNPDNTREIDADMTDTGTLIFRTYNETTAAKNGADNYMATGQLLGKFTTGTIDHTATAALDYVDNQTKYDYAVSGIDTTFDYANPIYATGPLPMTFFYSGEGAFKSYVRAVYAQDLMSFGKKWKALLGLRRDDITTVGYLDASATQRDHTSAEHSLTPRLGLVYQPTDYATIYASYSEAFVPLIGEDRFGQIFKPEESRSYEIGWRQQFSDALLLTFAVFDIEKKNIIVVDPVDTNFNINAGVARSQGFELEFAGRVTDQWRINTGLAYTDARITDSVDPTYFPKGDRLPAAARWSALFNTQYEFAMAPVRGLEVGMNIAYTSRREYAIPHLEPNTLEARPELPDFTRIDLFASYPIGERLSIQANASNLTDERVLLANGYGRVQFDPSRTYSLRVNYQIGSLR